jgi:hypothetical protein
VSNQYDLAGKCVKRIRVGSLKLPIRSLRNHGLLDAITKPERQMLGKLCGIGIRDVRRTTRIVRLDFNDQRKASPRGPQCCRGWPRRSDLRRERTRVSNVDIASRQLVGDRKPSRHRWSIVAPEDDRDVRRA